MNKLATTNKEYSLQLINQQPQVIPEQVAAKLMQALQMPNPPKFVKVGGDMIATHQISRIAKMSNISVGQLMERDADFHRKRGEWRCDHGLWHSRQFEDCSCQSPKSRHLALNQQLNECSYCQQLSIRKPERVQRNPQGKPSQFVPLFDNKL